MARGWLGVLWCLSAAVAGCGESHYVIGDNRAAAGGESGGAPALDCPAACTRGCLGRLCEVEPLADGTVPTCPPAFDCTVHCEQPGTCLGEVHCADASSCIVNCSGEKNCYGAIHCDNARNCQVICSGTEACRDVTCAATDRCAVTCTGSSSCAGDITCGSGACSVLCGGANSCAGVSSCESSCACDWQCEPGSACAAEPPLCRLGCDSGAGCSSASAGAACRTCN